MSREAYVTWRESLGISVSGKTTVTPEFVWDSAWQAALQHPQPAVPDGWIKVMRGWLSMRQEPIAWMFQHEDTGRTTCVAIGEAEDFAKLNPRWQKVCPLYKHPQPAVQHAGQGEAARETLASWMLMRGFSTGHGDTLCDLLTELDGQVHPQPAVPEDITKDLNYLYWSAYHAGHHDTVEGCYRDVYAVDRFDYWEDRVSECIDGGDMPAVKALLSAGKETDK
jgi:hypothetical protein